MAGATLVILPPAEYDALATLSDEGPAYVAFDLISEDEDLIERLLLHRPALVREEPAGYLSLTEHGERVLAGQR